MDKKNKPKLLDIITITPSLIGSTMTKAKHSCLVTGENVWGETVRMIIHASRYRIEIGAAQVLRGMTKVEDVFYYLTPYEIEFLKTGTEHLPLPLLPLLPLAEKETTCDDV